jgi:hypothetical protein
MRNESWLRLMSGLVLVGVFAAGTLFGAGLMKWTAPPPARLPPPHGMPHGGPIEAMTRELALTDAQVKRTIDIIASHHKDLEAIAHRTQGEVRDVMFAIENDLLPELSVEQQKRLEEWRKRRPPIPMGPPGMGPPGMGPPPPGMGPPPGGPQ